MICELEKNADLKGFQCVSARASWNSVIIYSVYAGPREGCWEVSERARKMSGFCFNNTDDRYVVNFTSALKICSTFYPNFLQSPISVESVSTIKFSRLMFLRSVYLWPSVRIAAIRPLTCELKRFESKRSAFIMWPCGPRCPQKRKITQFKGGLGL